MILLFVFKDECVKYESYDSYIDSNVGNIEDGEIEYPDIDKISHASESYSIDQIACASC